MEERAQARRSGRPVALLIMALAAALVATWTVFLVHVAVVLL